MRIQTVYSAAFTETALPVALPLQLCP